MKLLINPPMVILICILIIVLLFFIFPSCNYIIFPFNLLGIPIIYAGFSIMGKARAIFNKYETSLGYDTPKKLVREGVFSVTRNPMYLGMFILLMGTAICFQNIFSLIIPFLFVIYIHFAVIPREEEIMIGTFGKEYKNYQRNVRKWI